MRNRYCSGDNCLRTRPHIEGKKAVECAWCGKVSYRCGLGSKMPDGTLPSVAETNDANDKEKHDDDT